LRILEVRYERTKQIKQYEPEVLGLTAEVGDSDPKDVIHQLRAMVEAELNPTQPSLPLQLVPAKVEEKKDEVPPAKEVEQSKEEKKSRAKKGKVAESPKEVSRGQETSSGVGDKGNTKSDKKITLFDTANADHKKLFLDHVKTLYPKMVKDCPEHLAAKASLLEVKEIPFIDENGDVLPEFYKYVTTLMETKLAGSANVSEEAVV